MQIGSYQKLFKELTRLRDVSSLWHVVDNEVLNGEFNGVISTAESILHNAQDIVLYGAGNFTISVLSAWQHQNFPVRYLVDSDREKHRQTVLGYLVKDPEYLVQDQTRPLVVVAVMDSSDLINRLESLSVRYIFAERDGSVGFLPGHYLMQRRDSCEKLYSILADDFSRYVLLSVIIARMFQDFQFSMVGNIFTDRCATHPQYFPKDLPDIRDGERYLDCGAFDGDSLVCFAAQAINSRIRNWAALGIEGDQENAARARKNLSKFGLHDIKILNAVLGSGEETVKSLKLHNCSGGLIENGKRTEALDNLIGNFKPTFIKMDIEGAEMSALIGAEQTIIACHPRLAICTYHSTAELIEIPLLIHSQFPDYKLYLRHHRAGSLWETVCYAI